MSRQDDASLTAITGPKGFRTSRNTVKAERELCDTAIRTGWTLTQAQRPDFFGDVRIFADNGIHTMLMVFERSGKIAGAYLTPQHGNPRHTESYSQTEEWLREFTDDRVELDA